MKTPHKLKPSRIPRALVMGLVILCVTGALSLHYFISTTHASASRWQPSCGTVRVSLNGTIPSNVVEADNAESCFWRAYQTGQHQFLTLQQTGIDAGSIHQFELVRRGPFLRIVDEVSPYTIVGPNSHRIVYHVYRYMTRDIAGLHVLSSQDAGDILIPA